MRRAEMVERDGPGSQPGVQKPNITRRASASLPLAVVASYLGAQVLRDAAKQLAVTGTGALVLSGLVSIAGHALPRRR
jgi:hypothetical protein